ncbi:MAG: hypothetical protein K9L86_00425 [Candidatus Omnitrophica bacterium]|nr:hypothetical protein [Candidatus Omnitrophota bacterium]
MIVYVGGASMRKTDKRKKIILKLLLVWLVGNICFFKYIGLLAVSMSRISWFASMPKIPMPGIVLPLGISYIIFRLIHYIVEVYRRNMPESSFSDFGLYILFFPTFLAGPVERFHNFHSQTRAQKSISAGTSLGDINYGLFRIICGMVKKFIIGDSLARLIMPLLNSPQNYSRLLVLVSIYGLAVRIYMDFSGYTDMAIGIARLFGYRIVENFKKPFFQKNIALFWRNWHISVYTWIRDYFFFPFFGHRASSVKVYAGVFFSMLVFMLWHGGNFNFFILGIYHGLGLLTWYGFQEIKRKHPAIRRLTVKPYLDPLAIFFTFSFVSFGFIVFALDINCAKAILQRVFFV